MTLSLEQLSSRMRRGEDIPLRETAQVVLALSIPSILQQMVVTAMEYIDAAMVGHIGAEATAAIGIVSSSTWLLHGILVGPINGMNDERKVLFPIHRDHINQNLNLKQNSGY